MVNVPGQLHYEWERFGVMSEDKTLKPKPKTLGEGDVSSQRVTRRSLLGTLGIGAGVAAAAAVVATTGAEAQRYSDPAGYGRCGLRSTRADPYDRGPNSDPRTIRVRCTDGD
jgi:hypothetical protein